MTKAIKCLSIATLIAGLAAVPATAQEAADPHHPKEPAAAGAPVPQAQPAQPGQSAGPMKGGGMGGMMSGDQMPMMKMMQEMHGKMMGGGMMRQPKGDTGPSSQAFNGLVTKMTQDMTMPFTGDADFDFVKRMIPHHQGAIDMAITVLAFGKDPEVKKMAESIIKAQETEIGLLKEWLKMKGQ
jgi:uncharacterized protein (DUF305 family)